MTLKELEEEYGPFAHQGDQIAAAILHLASMVDSVDDSIHRVEVSIDRVEVSIDDIKDVLANGEDR